jgi:hypothetical protein
MSAEDTGFDLLPVVNDPPEPLEELSLLDQLADPSTLPPATPEPTPLGRSYAYDIANRTFLASPSGGPLMTYGADTLKAWIEKAMLTERGAAPVHRVPDYGMDGAYDFIDGGPFDAGAAGELEARLRDCLTVHPRIEDITNFAVDYDDGVETGEPPDDAVFVSFTVVVAGDDIDALSITRYPLASPGPAEQE